MFVFISKREYNNAYSWKCIYFCTPLILYTVYMHSFLKTAFVWCTPKTFWVFSINNKYQSLSIVKAYFPSYRFFTRGLITLRFCIFIHIADVAFMKRNLIRKFNRFFWKMEIKQNFLFCKIKPLPFVQKNLSSKV